MLSERYDFAEFVGALKDKTIAELQIATRREVDEAGRRLKPQRGSTRARPQYPAGLERYFLTLKALNFWLATGNVLASMDANAKAMVRPMVERFQRDGVLKPGSLDAFDGAGVE